MTSGKKDKTWQNLVESPEKNEIMSIFPLITSSTRQPLLRCGPARSRGVTGKVIMKAQNKLKSLLISSSILVLIGFGLSIYIARNYKKSIKERTLLPQERYTSINSQKHKIDLGKFKLITPKSFRVELFQGIDSYVGQITNGIDTYNFDYGWYSNNLQGTYDHNQLACRDIVNGKSVFLIRPQKNGLGVLGIYFPEVNEKDRLVLSGRNIKDEEIGLAIFSSIQFNLNNSAPRQEELGSNCMPYVNIENLFRANCASCHHIQRSLTGPPLGGFSGELLIEWFEKDDSEWIPKNKELAYGPERHRKRFPSLKDSDLKSIGDYLEIIN